MAGFDPPIQYDSADDPTNPGRNRPKFDFDSPEWWTSVSREGTLNVNNSIIVEFASDTMAADYTVKVDKNHNGKVAVSIVGGMKRETHLRIQGQTGAEPDEATPTKIHLFKLKDWQQKGDNAKPVRTLSVMVLPERHVQLGIWYVTAPAPTDSAHASTTLPVKTPNKDKILRRINDTFRQACIVFDLDPASGPIVLPYDTTPEDGKLQTDVPSDPEYSVIFNSPLIKSKLNLIIAKDIAQPTKKDTAGFCPKPGESRKVMVFTQKFVNRFEINEYSDFDCACAHEIGHALKLSTRGGDARHDNAHFPGAEMGANTTTSMYDNDHLEGSGVIGREMYHDGALMRSVASSNRWIRHEDWQQANDIAGGIK